MGRIVDIKLNGTRQALKGFQNYLEQAMVAGPMPSVDVGYESHYAIYQHENLAYVHTIGQAKFLEAPARRHFNEIVRTVREEFWQKGRKLHTALTAGAKILFDASQNLVPVDTGLLKLSGYIRRG